MQSIADTSGSDEYKYTPQITANTVKTMDASQTG